MDNPSETKRSGPKSTTMRRHEAVPYGIAIFATAGIGLAAAVNWPLSAADASGYAAGVVFMLAISYIGGPSAYVKVTPSSVVVANTLRLLVVPRGLIASIGDYDNLHVKIMLRNGGSVRVGAFEPGLYPALDRSYRVYMRHGRDLERALEQVPSQDSDGGTVSWRPRYSNLAVMLLTVALLLFTILWGFPRM